MKKSLSVIVGFIVILVVMGGMVFVGGYRQAQAPSPVNSPQETSTRGQARISEDDILKNLANNWQSAQASVPFRPSFHNQLENQKGIWRLPSAVQFMENNVLLVRFEDDNNVNAAVFGFKDNSFSLLETFKNTGNFSSEVWNDLAKKYGNPAYPPVTYATDLMRDGKPVTFDGLTKVPENVFLKDYWKQ